MTQHIHTKKEFASLADTTEHLVNEGKHGVTLRAVHEYCKENSEFEKIHFKRILNAFARIEDSVEKRMVMAELHASVNNWTASLAEVAQITYNYMLDNASEEQSERFRDFTKKAIKKLGEDQLSDSHAFLKRFYLEGIANKTGALGTKAFRKKRKIEYLLGQGRSIKKNDYFIRFLKIYSSATPVMVPRKVGAVGGGYFLAMGGYGLVVDPGHHFLDNFLRSNFTIDDINGIAVTHFHDDHYADLPALFSLIYRRKRKRPSLKVDFWADEISLSMFSRFIRQSDYIRRGENLTHRAKTGRLIQLADGISMKAIPTSHQVFQTRKKGVGLLLHVREKGRSIVITGDTSWSKKIEETYRKLRLKRPSILIPHVSSVFEGEIPYYRDLLQPHPNHLCLYGLGKAIEACQPHTVLLSEIGEELGDVIDEIAGLTIECFDCVKECKWYRPSDAERQLSVNCDQYDL